MAKMMNRKTIAFMIAVLMIFGLTVSQSSAYFVAYTDAAGTKTVTLEAQTELIEELEGHDKKIQIKNTGESDVFVRVKVFYAQQTDVSVKISGDNWTLKEGCYYYSRPLARDEVTETLEVEVEVPKDYDQDFQITVVQEYVIAVYDGDEAQMERSWEMASGNEGGDHNE